VRLLRRAVSEGKSFGELVGESAAMRAVYDLIDRVSGSESSVLITGESGTGKEVVARTLHERSKRSAGPFVAINCAAMPEQLLESELFGHTKGAFTDARAPKNGLFLEANGGTLFLDEIGDMPITLQPKILRALQDRKVRPVGGSQEIPFDARILAATNRDLETMVEEQRFREDLYYRINVIHIPLPPLRARGSDTLLLAQRFIDHFAARASKPVTGITPEAAQKLNDYSWPGNVRELGNCIERAIALTRYDKLTIEDLPDKVRAYKPSHVIFPAEDPRDIVPLEEVERRYILRVFEAAGHNRSLAAQLLGVDRKTLYRKLEKYGSGSSKSQSNAGGAGSAGGGPPSTNNT
jgi:two-component system response regulator HydG